MSHRPPSLQSEISSAASESDLAPLPQHQAPVVTRIQHGYTHVPGIPLPGVRSLRSPTPTSRSPIPPSPIPPSPVPYIRSPVPPATSPTPPSMFGGASSRPQSPISQVGRSHVRSIAAQGFLNPMTPRQLQAQRSGRHEDLYTPSPTQASGFDDSRSITSSRQGPYASLPRGHRATPSVTTAHSESEIPDQFDQNPRYLPGGDGPRQFFEPSSSNARRNQAPLGLNLSNSLRVGSIREDIKSPRSFRSGLSLGSKHRFEPGHQHLGSTSSTPRQNEKILDINKPRKILGKNYEYFEGNTIFWWGGRLQNAKDRPISIATAIIIILPAVLYFVFSASWLWHHVSPALPIIFAYILFICFSSFLHASFVDPGIIPRNVQPFPPAGDDPLEIGPPTNDWVTVRLADSEDAAMDVPVKYCKTCNVWRPPRCYHCRVCDNCVETLDHHCVWLNNCVGRRNYRYFFTFISSGTILALYLAFSSLGHVLAYSTQTNISLTESIDVNRVPFAMFIYGLLVMAYPAALLGYHLMLTGRGETTREYLSARRFPKDERHRPFNLGNVFSNWMAVFARPKHPTYVHFKQEYQEGDQRLGPRRTHVAARGKGDTSGREMEMKPVGYKSFEGPQSKKKLDAR